MRHARSILYAVVLGPAVWVLCALGLSPDTDGGTFAALLLAGAAYAILAFAPISPIGPAVAGLVFLGAALWALIAPGSYAGAWPSGPDLDPSRPGYAVAVLLAVPLLATMLSARRWEKYEPPHMPLIGRIGRARGLVAVPGGAAAPERVSAEENTTLLTPGASAGDAVDRTGDTTLLSRPESRDESGDTTLLFQPGSREDTTLLSEPDTAGVARQGERPMAGAGVDEETTLITRADGRDRRETDEPTVEVRSAKEKPAGAEPADAEPTVEDEPTAAVDGASEDAAEASGAAASAGNTGEATADVAAHDSPTVDVAARDEQPAAAADEPPTVDMTAPEKRADDADREPPTADVAASGTETSQEPPTVDVIGSDARPEEPATVDVLAPGAESAGDTAADDRPTVDITGRDGVGDRDRTQVILLPRPEEPAREAGDRTQAIGVGERTQVIFRREPSGAEVSRAAAAQAERDHTAQERSRQAFRDLAAQQRARQAFDDRAAGQARDRGDETQVITTRSGGPTVEAPGDRTQVLSIPTGSRPAPEAPTRESILSAERPDPGADPTTRLVPPQRRSPESPADPGERPRGVLDLERPSDESADDTTRL